MKKLNRNAKEFPALGGQNFDFGDFGTSENNNNDDYEQDRNQQNQKYKQKQPKYQVKQDNQPKLQPKYQVKQQDNSNDNNNQQKSQKYKLKDTSSEYVVKDTQPQPKYQVKQDNNNNNNKQSQKYQVKEDKKPQQYQVKQDNNTQQSQPKYKVKDSQQTTYKVKKEQQQYHEEDKYDNDDYYDDRNYNDQYYDDRSYDDQYDDDRNYNDQYYDDGYYSGDYSDSFDSDYDELANDDNLDYGYQQQMKYAQKQQKSEEQQEQQSKQKTTKKNLFETSVAQNQRAQHFTNSQQFDIKKQSSFQKQRYYSTKPGMDSDQQYTVLMVAEKPSIAQSISQALTNKKYKERKGISKVVKVQEFSGNLFGKPAYFKVTSVAGHVFQRDFPPQFQNWEKTDPQDLFKADTVRKEANPKQRIAQHLKKEAQNCTHLILWLDNDREGENICFEVLDCVQSVMARRNYQQVFRAKFSSLTTPDLLYAYQNLRDEPDRLESISVDARQIIDLKIGIAFSRFQTQYFTLKYPDLANKKITFGPCQTPTLGFCVARHDQIKNFTPKPYFRINCQISDKGRTISAACKLGHIQSEQEAKKIANNVQNQGVLTVVSVSQKEATKVRPEALNTVTLLKVASNNLGIGPHETMQVAERLYLSGYISYPRTESTKYAPSFNFKEILSNLRGHSDLGGHASNIINTGFNKGRGGKDFGDHPPITCTVNIPKGLSGNASRIYDYIASHFMASISHDAKYLKKSVLFECAGVQFEAQGSSILQPGFISVMPWINIGDENEGGVFSCQKGYQIQTYSAAYTSHLTSPPDYLSEADLIDLMEKNGIGTDASMAQHINNICDREYVKVTGGSRRLVPTQIGLALAHGYEKIDKELVLPALRQNIEASVGQIAQGQRDFDEVLNTSIKIFTEKFQIFKAKISNMDVMFNEFLKSVTQSLEQTKPFSKCGKCKRFMKIIEKMGKIICETCQIELQLPKEGKYRITSEKTCPLDGYQVVTFTANHEPHITSNICPKCYQGKGDIEDEIENISCNLCQQLTCSLSAAKNFIGFCSNCDDGDLILEPTVTQNKLQISCNKCWLSFIFKALVKKIEVLQDKCQECEARLVKGSLGAIKEKQGEQQKGVKKPDEVKNYDALCLFCDKSFSEVMREKKYIATSGMGNRSGGGGRGRGGRGRGRGGRGRGRGGKGRGKGRGGKRGGGRGRSNNDEDNIQWF